MMNLEENKSLFYYCLYKDQTIETDSAGYETGGKIVNYYTGVPCRGNISPAAGAAQFAQFGRMSSAERVIVIDWMDCPIDENTVLFVDKAPEYDSNGNPIYDYYVTQVAKSFWSISIGIAKVTTS